MRIGFVTIIAIMSLLIFRTYFVIFLEFDLQTTILIIAILGSSQNLLQIFFRIPLGTFSQIFGRKPLIFFGLACFSFALLLQFFAWNWYLPAIGSIFIAVGMSCYWPAAFAHIGDISEENYGKLSSKMFQYGDIGTILASLAAKYLLDIQQYIPSFTLFSLYGLFAFIAITLTVISWFFFKESHFDTIPLNLQNIRKHLLFSFKHMPGEFIKISKLDRMLKIYLIQLIVSFVEFGFILYFPRLVVNFNFTNGNVAEIILYGTIMNFFLKFLLGKISDKFHYASQIAVAILGTGIILIFVSIFGTEFWVLLTVFTLFLAMIMLCYFGINAATSNTSPTKLRGHAFGVLGVYTSFGRGLSTLFFGLLLLNLNLTSSFLVFGILTFTFGMVIIGSNFRPEKQPLSKQPV